MTFARSRSRAHLSLAALWLALVASACTRYADLRDEPSVSFTEEPPPVDDGELVEVSIALGPPEFPACEARSDVACYGDLDFPCAFDTWVAALVDECQTQTGCVTNGDLQVALASDGCVGGLAMSRPNETFIACLAQGFGATRCPCDGSPVVELFLGLGNDGCED